MSSSGYPRAVKAWLVVIAVAACSKSPPAEKTKRLALDPLPVTIEVPDYAITSRHSDQVMLVSARACIVLVTAAPADSLADAQAAVTAQHAGAVIERAGPEFFAARYAGATGQPVQSFQLRTTLGGATYKCEPFTARADVACEERACRSLRAGPAAPTAPASP
jgi:hypothetical protein